MAGGGKPPAGRGGKAPGGAGAPPKGGKGPGGPGAGGAGGAPGSGTGLAPWLLLAALVLVADQLTKVFGGAQLQQMAQSAGMDAGQFESQLAELLPQMVDKLTPEGQLPKGGLEDALGMLGSLLRRRHVNIAAVALANKNARTIWALMAHDREFQADYQPRLAAA